MTHLTYRPTVETEEPLVVELWARWHKKGEALIDHHPIAIPTKARSIRGRGEVVEYWFEAEGWWSPIYPVLSEGGPVTLDWLIYPTGTLSGEIRVPKGQEIPKEIEARFEQAMDSGPKYPIPRDKVKCPITDGLFECDIPAGVLDLRLKADGFISHYFWSSTLDRGGEKNVGNLLLLPGSSVVGRVEDGLTGEG